LLDLTGGSLSFAQIAIDGWGCGQALFGKGAFNVVKFILSVMSIFFDTIFLIQHYCLYRSAWVNAKDKKNMTLLQQTIEDADNGKNIDTLNVTDSNQTK
jgi:cystinosin